MRRKPIYVCRLSVTNTPYLGIDLTDEGKKTNAVGIAEARYGYRPKNTAASYYWEFESPRHGVIAAQDDENGTARLESARPALPSATYQGDYVRCAATLTETNPPDGHAPCTASATATNAITIVRVDVQIGGVAEDKEETEGAFVQFVQDTNGVISVEGTNAMKKTTVVFSCTPALPPDELVEVSCSGKGELYEEEPPGGMLLLVTTKSYRACDIGTRKFMLHGHNASGALRDGSIKIKHVKSGALDIAKYTVLKVDLKAEDLFGRVDDSIEDSEGAYVHWNIDNDDSSNNAVGGTKHPGGDYLQTGIGQVSKEDDLKPLSMVLSPCPSEGMVVLRVGSDKGKIWKNSEKGSTNLVAAGVGEMRWNLADAGHRREFNALCSGLWVEGVGKGECKVTLSYGGNCSDTVKYTFIAANCGRQPRTDGSERDALERHFPGLIRCEWSITGNAARKYNCIAWSVGEDSAWYVATAGAKLHPTDISIDDVWGDGDGMMTITELDAFYAAKGYLPTGTDAKDADVMFYSGFHGARKKNCLCQTILQPVFESKCGEGPKIEHSCSQLNGMTYGTPIRFYKHK